MALGHKMASQGHEHQDRQGCNSATRSSAAVSLYLGHDSNAVPAGAVYEQVRLYIRRQRRAAIPVFNTSCRSAAFPAAAAHIGSVSTSKAASAACAACMCSLLMSPTAVLPVKARLRAPASWLDSAIRPFSAELATPATCTCSI